MIGEALHWVEGLYHELKKWNSEDFVHWRKKHLVEIQDLSCKFAHPVGLKISHKVTVLFKFLLIFDLKKTLLEQFI